MIREEHRKYKLKESDLAKLSKGDPLKIAIARRLREETLVTIKWIATRLTMGSAGYLTNRLYLNRKGKL